MAFKPSLSIANFTCRFGDEKVLLDLFEEVIYPAFFDSPPRLYSKNVFHLFDLDFKKVEDGKVSEPFISGRFVRDMDLTRSHILRENHLIPDSGQLESATSARFVLMLSSHTLLYVSETPHAPPLGMFRSTIQYHLKNSWFKYIKAEAKRRRKANPKGPKIAEILQRLLKEIPPPELNLIELPSSNSIEQFLARFKEIDRVEYRINDTNHNSDFAPLINELRTQRKATESTQIIVIETKPKNRNVLSQQMNDVTRAGHVDAKVSGKGTNGGRISGTNEEFRISVPIGTLPETMKEFVGVVYTQFKKLVDSGEILVRRANGHLATKLDEVTERCEKLDDR